MCLSWQTRGGGGGEETNWKVYVHVSFNGPFSRKWALKFSSRQESRVSLLINEDWNRSNGLWDGKPFSSRVIHARRFSRPTGLLLSDNQISTPTYSSSHCKKNFWSSNCDRLEVFTFFHRFEQSLNWRDIVYRQFHYYPSCSLLRSMFLVIKIVSMIASLIWLNVPSKFRYNLYFSPVSF